MCCVKAPFLGILTCLVQHSGADYHEAPYHDHITDSNMKRHVDRQFSFVPLKTLRHVFLLRCYKELYNFGCNGRLTETAISMATQSLEVMALRYNGDDDKHLNCAVCDFYFHLKG